jgi:uncharacterized protein
MLKSYFDSFEDLQFSQISGPPFGTYEDLKRKVHSILMNDFMGNNGDITHQVHVGTDSQNKGRRTKFVTLIIFHRIGKGGFGFWTGYQVEKMKSMTQRLFTETQRTIEFVQPFNDIFDEFGIVPFVHADVNPNRKYKSNTIVDEVVGYITAQHYTPVIKPDAWVASHGADHLVREF